MTYDTCACGELPTLTFSDGVSYLPTGHHGLGFCYDKDNKRIYRPDLVIRYGILKIWNEFYAEAWDERVREEKVKGYLEPTPHYYAVGVAAAKLAKKGIDIGKYLSDPYAIVVMDVRTGHVIHDTNKK